MDSKNISFFELDGKSYLLIDQNLFGSKWYNYKDAYNYYDTDVNNILLFLVLNGIIIKMLTIIMILMLIIYYFIKKMIMIMLLDILINIDQQLHHYK